MKQAPYAIIDLETTGSSPTRGDRIIEIAVVLHDGQKVLDSFSSLIDPGKPIPSMITRITGIKDHMVEGAPKFYEVARQVVEMTKGSVFVAHNVRFDYNFLRTVFSELGFNYNRRKLCTVRMCREAFPGLPSYALGKLIRHFDIPVNHRHRALDDALATAELLRRVLNQQSGLATVEELINYGIQASRLPEHITLEQLHKLPESCGVYYMHDAHGNLIYVGKSLNIKKRIMDHFANKTRKAREMQQLVHDITFQETGSELVALLQESHDIKQYLPPYNTAQRSKRFPWVIHETRNRDGYKCLTIEKANLQERKDLSVVQSFASFSAAKRRLNRLVDRHELCQRFSGLDKQRGPCFAFHLHKCKGACIGKESSRAYNRRFNQVVGRLKEAFEKNYLIIDRGRRTEEQSVILVENGLYQGYGFIDVSESLSLEDMKDSIKPYPHNPDVARILRYFMDKKSDGLQVLKF